MKIIAFGDLHMAVQICRNIPDIKDADLLIATGDLTNYGKKPEAKAVLEELLEINPHLLAIIGNLDNFEINDYLDQLDLNLHGQAKLLQNKVCIMGVGGSNITPFSTPFEMTEEQIGTVLGSAYDQAKEYLSLVTPSGKARVPLLLISHTPPYGTKVDKLKNGKHVGSKAVRRFIEKHQPELCVCGHIHEARGEDTIGKTKIVNPGMLQHGGWVEIEFKQSTLHATLQ